MDTTDQQLELIFTWIRKTECNAENLIKMALEMESLKEKCNASDCVGTAVAAAVFLIGTTLLTGGATAPSLDLVGTGCSGVGATISVATTITEQFMSCVTMTGMQDLEKQSNKTAGEMQELFKQLRKQVSVNEGSSHMTPNQSFFTPQLLLSLPGKCLSVEEAQQLIKEAAKIGLKRATIRGAMAVGGAVGNHVNEASQSLRDTTNEILKSKKKFEETTESQRKHQKTCAESQRDEDSDSEDEDSYGEDEDDYGENEDGYDEDGYGEDEDGYDEDEDGYDEDGYGEDEDGYDEDQDSEDEDGEDEDEDGYGEDEDCYDEDEDGEDGEDEDEDGYGEDEDCYDENEDEDGYGEDEDEESYGKDEDEEFDQGDEDSEEETEDDESKKTGRKQKRKHQKPMQNKDLDHFSGHKLNTRKRKFENHQNPSASIRVGLLNVQSMNNKTHEVFDIITQNNLDVLCTTETWLQRHTGHNILRDASPLGFSFYYQARPYRGGGVAVQFLNTLQHKRFRFNCTLTTFEVVATVLQHDEWEEPALIINVYRPPGSNLTEFQEFLDQFEELLRQAKNYNSVIVTGDFNIWFDPENRSYTDEFLWLLPIYDFVQHVKVPTHEAGHILDLVITRNVEISCLCVRDNGISDHYTVYFNVRPKPKKSTTENTDGGEQVKRFKKSK